MTWASFLGVQGHLGVAAGPFWDVFGSILGPELVKSYQKYDVVVLCHIFWRVGDIFLTFFMILKLGGTVILVKKRCFYDVLSMCPWFIVFMV